jgi:C_GCAxxG_C_C family probable redox protein
MRRKKPNTEKAMKQDIILARRQFLLLSATSGAAGIHASEILAVEEKDTDFKVLAEQDKIIIGADTKEISQKAYDFGTEYIKKFYSCSRGSVAALQEAIPFIPKDKDLIRAASCLDGGATPTRLASCGAFTGCGMILGYICGKDTFDKTELSHALIQELHTKFIEKYGSVLCKDVSEAAKKNCSEVVGLASSWTAEIILKQFTIPSK